MTDFDDAIRRIRESRQVMAHAEELSEVTDEDIDTLEAMIESVSDPVEKQRWKESVVTSGSTRRPLATFAC